MFALLGTGAGLLCGTEESELSDELDDEPDSDEELDSDELDSDELSGSVDEDELVSVGASNELLSPEDGLLE